MSVEININKVVKKYGDLTIIPGLDEHIKNGEFFTLLGPSGCGKTTLLRMIAGFNSIEGGTIAFNDKVINDIPAHERNIGMVFQSYAIFPHLTVRENVEYGLKLRKMPKDEMKRKVDDPYRDSSDDQHLLYGNSGTGRHAGGNERKGYIIVIRRY